MKKYTTILFVCLGIIVIGREKPGIEPKLTETPPTIDGKLDDQVWQTAVSVSGFQTYRPDYGKEMSQKTVAYMSYDEENLYFAFRCFDDPNLIKTSIAARDKIRDDDWVRINLDSFNDSQSLYSFYVNPNGIQMDSRAAGYRDDPGVDFIWYSAGVVTPDGYDVEIQIPFKSIRYSYDKGVVNMGIVFERYISRYSERGTYPSLDPKIGDNLLLQTLELEYVGVKKNVLLEVLPSVIYSWNKYEEKGEAKIKSGLPELGVTGKIGITSDLVLDLTVNPDFSQVESDVSQIEDNQRFALRYPERRPFFQEGSENFRFEGSGMSEGIQSIVNTRTIVNPNLAAKLTGKIGELNRISTIYARDELQPDSLYTDDVADVAILRYRRSLSKDNDSYVGLFGTSRLANDRFNLVSGIDSKIRINQQSDISGNYFRSFVRDSVDIRTDSASVEENSYDTWAIGYSYGSRRLSISANIFNYDDGFVTDVGYARRLGIVRYNVFIRPSWYFDHPIIQRVDNWTSLSQMYDKPTGLWEYSYYFNFRINMIRNSNLSFAVNPKTEIYEGVEYNRTSIRVQGESQITKRVNLRLEYRGGRNIGYYGSDAFVGFGKNIQGSVSWQANDKFNTDIRLTYSDLFESGKTSFLYNSGLDKLNFRSFIIRSRNTYQLNKYLFFRGIFEYRKRMTYDDVAQVFISKPNLTADFLISFTLIPGTVIHAGYGFETNKNSWNPVEEMYESTLDQYRMFRRGLFFKASYLWRY